MQKEKEWKTKSRKAGKIYEEMPIYQKNNGVQLVS